MARIRTPDVDAHTLHLHLAVALKSHDMRRACLAVERIVSTIDLLDELPTAALEEVRNFCTDYNKGRKGEFSEFKRAFIALVVAHLNNVRLEESRLFHGITGLPERGRDELGACPSIRDRRF